jgi:hypothetical protein
MLRLCQKRPVHFGNLLAWQRRLALRCSYPLVGLGTDRVRVAGGGAPISCGFKSGEVVMFHDNGRRKRLVKRGGCDP